MTCHKSKISFFEYVRKVKAKKWCYIRRNEIGFPSQYFLFLFLTCTHKQSCQQQQLASVEQQPEETRLLHDTILLRALQPYQNHTRLLFTPSCDKMTIEGRQQWLAQQRQKREGICQDAALLKKYSIGTALTDEEKKRVQRLKKNAQQRKRRRKDTALLNKYYKKNAQPVTDKEEKRVCQLDNAQIKKHWMRQNRNTRAAEEDK